jgi:formylglycine-generating enzyme required for sulfatase activity
MSVNLEPEMIVILAGEFPAGCETGAANGRPAHPVRVDRFGLGRRTAVTNRLYRIFLEETGRTAPAGLQRRALQSSRSTGDKPGRKQSNVF